VNDCCLTPIESFLSIIHDENKFTNNKSCR
jgi:hypothetical protein